MGEKTHPMKCKILPNYSTKKDGTCIRYSLCLARSVSPGKCPATSDPKSQRITKKTRTPLSKEQKEHLKRLREIGGLFGAKKEKE